MKLKREQEATLIQSRLAGREFGFNLRRVVIDQTHLYIQCVPFCRACTDLCIQRKEIENESGNI